MSDVILLLYRIAMQLRRWHVPVLPVMIQYMIRLVFGCHISLGARIGKYTHLAYGGLGTVIHSDCVIGENVYIGTNVTIGGRNGTGRVPVIRNASLIVSLRFVSFSSVRGRAGALPSRNYQPVCRASAGSCAGALPECTRPTTGFPWGGESTGDQRPRRQYY